MVKTLDEYIQYCEEVAEELDMKAGFETDYQAYTMSEMERQRCRECASEHRQLAEWLKELKEYRKNYTCFNCYNSSASFSDYPCCECRRCFKALDGIKDYYEEVNADE